MIKPNYKNGSIVNLMSSIRMACGAKTSIYEPLADFDLAKLAQKNIILIIIDGLGYEYLIKNGQGSFLYNHLQRKITSVFPATTAAAMTSYSTGLAPQQHGLTGWFMYLKEVGAIIMPLPFATRAGWMQLELGGIKYQDIYNEKSVFSGLTTTSFSIKHKKYINSKSFLAMNQGAKKLFFTKVNGFFRQINKAVKLNNERRFVMAYWSKLDSLFHQEGTEGVKAEKHFWELDKKISLLAQSVKNRNTIIIVSADHGLMNTIKEDQVIHLKDHPKLAETLILPFSGDSRAVYCYVRPDKVKQFEKYATTNLKKYCVMHKSVNLIKDNYFGLFEPNEKLKDRIGDYTLIMKDNYIMRDSVLGEKRSNFTGHHGGMSKEEMFVPLVVIE